MVRGSCLCGGIAWEVDGPLELMGHCHCSMCRKAHGAAFETGASTTADKFRWVRGEELIRLYESHPGSHRAFCSRCGSVIPGVSVANEGRVFISAGCLDDDPGTRPIAHIFVASKAPWQEITDELPCFDAYPPGYGGEEIERETLPPPRTGVVRGSCLCGSVAYESEGGLVRFRNCHCSRCRKARSAAFASNLFVEPKGFRWTRGEDLLDTYEVPGAKRFMTVFCRVCGSSLPRTGLPEFVVVPAGSLDDDPGMRPEMHIFVGSKAEWHEITDDLPQHEEYPP
jgi:hypothetical protein